MTVSPPYNARFRPPQIKICGLTDAEEARRCVELGADAIGLIFFPKSPRHVSDKTARTICRFLPEHIPGIGVFVEQKYDCI